MNRKSVTSSNIKSIGYNGLQEILEIEFHSGGIYNYSKVSIEVFAEFSTSPSIGKAFFKLIKGKHPFLKGEYKEIIKPFNIYFSGEAGSGKTVAAQQLMKELGYLPAKIANPVYALARNYFGMANKDRNLLQVIGSDCGRDIVSENVWVDRFVQDTAIVSLAREKMGLEEVGFVSDDCRFLNEHLALKKAGWVGIYLNASEEVRLGRLQDRDGKTQLNTLGHSAEVDVRKFQDDLMQFDANVSLVEANNSIIDLVKELRSKNNV